MSRPRSTSTCRAMDLRRPIYEKTAENGHFGHSDFPWEKPKQLDVPAVVLDRLEKAKSDAAHALNTEGGVPVRVASKHNMAY